MDNEILRGFDRQANENMEMRVLDVCQKIGLTSECNRPYTSTLANKFLDEGLVIEDMKVSELLAVIDAHDKWFKENSGAWF